MRRVRVGSPVATGQPVALDVVGDRGDVLVRAGAELTPRRQRLLADRGAAWCFIVDPAGTAIQAGPVLTGELERTCREAVSAFIETLERQARGMLRQPTARLLEAIQGGGIAAPPSTAECFDRLREAAAGIAGLSRELDGRSGYLLARHGLDEMIGHPVGVAVIAARIGALVGFEQHDVEATALAALMHDVGLIFVPAEVRTMPPQRRDRAQQRRYEEHTVLGEALLRRMFRESYPGIVAAEHHEHQAGDGYPRRLNGRNRVLRDADDIRDASRLALVSEIVAVADRYERLIAPGPGSQGLPAWAARRELTGLARHALNAEVVERFVASIPVLPVGSEVRVSGGARDGALAVVSQPSFADPHRPRVILVEDATGHRLDAVEIDLGAADARAIWEDVAVVEAAAR